MDGTRPQAPPAGEIVCVRRRAIDAVAADWDRFVPRDVPHLRAGFLKAVERGGVVNKPAYLLAYRAGRPVGAAVVYSLLLDTTMPAPPHIRRFISRIRERAPGFLRSSMLICGSPISNAESGMWLDPELRSEDRRQVFACLARAVLQMARTDQAIFFKEFTDEQVSDHASRLDELGFFSAPSWAGTRLEIAWPSFDAYLTGLRKRYRSLIRKDLKAAEGLELSLLDDFADLAPTASALYERVYGQAAFALERANAEFFAAVSEFDQAGLLVARERSSGEVLGINLLLFGDTCMHNLFIGFDYERNEHFHTYFNLVEESLRLAIERGCKVCYFGQDSYEFKARLGAKPFRLTAYMKHRLWPVHFMLRASRNVFFPPNEPVTHDVFHGD